MSKKKRVSVFDPDKKQFRIGIERDGVVKTSDGKRKYANEFPAKEDKPYFEEKKGGSNDNA